MKIKQKNIVYWYLNRLIDYYIMYEVFEQLRLKCEDKSDEQVNTIITKYLNSIQSYSQISEITRFRQYSEKE